MQGSFLEYAYSVIYSRALPDARDGLKPVQRRILYQMSDMGLRPDRGHVKSARVVGEVMGKLHPHGDAAIYDALVRLAQPFSLRAAAGRRPRQLRLARRRPGRPPVHRGAPGARRAGDDRRASTRTSSTSSRTTTTSSRSPRCCPPAIPNLLVNGARGIAVGMATNMAPHNLVEVVAAARHLRRCTRTPRSRTCMRFVPGPDLPVRRQDRRPRRRPRRLPRPAAARSAPAATVADRERHAASARASSSPSCPTRSARRRSSRRSRTACRPRSSPASPTSPTSPTASTACASSSGSRPASTPRPCSSSSTGYTPLEDSFSHQQRRARRRPARARSGCASCCVVYVEHRARWSSRRRIRVPAGQAAGAPAPGRGPAHRDPRHRRGHPGHPHVRRRRHGARPAARACSTSVELQAEYILELRLRRLTQFSRIELEKERDAAAPRRSPSCATILADDARLRALVSDEMAEVAATLRHPAPHDPARVGRRHVDHRRPRRPRRGRTRWRSPTPRAGCCCPARACSPAPRPRTCRARVEGARRAKHDVRRPPRCRPPRAPRSAS